MVKRHQCSYHGNLFASNGAVFTYYWLHLTHIVCWGGGMGELGHTPLENAMNYTKANSSKGDVATLHCFTHCKNKLVVSTSEWLPWLQTS